MPYSRKADIDQFDERGFERAFEWLEMAYEERSGWLPRLKIDPWFNRLHQDPRFADLLVRVELLEGSLGSARKT